ncbi:hypothetical protein GF357_03125 [Candidatus Dojkabacteria bacterium]|nr:hypothetical protein [Candidatus Dojkabacteria bacterium]
MKDDIPYHYICHLAKFLPDRKASKTGPKPISKIIILTELYKLFKYNCGWRNIEHSSTCRNYLYEMQRRGYFKKFFNLITQDFTEKRLSKTIIDSSDIISYRTNGLVRCSGKYHNYCIKMSVEFPSDYIPVSYSIDRGSSSDSQILDKMI